MTVLIDSHLKQDDAVKFASQYTKPGMFHMAVNNKFRKCGKCRHFIKKDQRSIMGIKTSRCELLHKQNGPKARKYQPRIKADYYGCKHWKSGKSVAGPEDRPEWKQEALF